MLHNINIGTYRYRLIYQLCFACILFIGRIKIACMIVIFIYNKRFINCHIYKKKTWEVRNHSILRKKNKKKRQ